MGNWSKYQTGKPDVTDEYQSSIDLIADRIDNNENGLNGDDALTSIDINGGAIDGTPIGASSESTGNFSTVTASSATITTLVASSADINGGNIDGTIIGASSAEAGSFTTIASSDDITIASGKGLDIGSNQVVTDQQVAVADVPTGAGASGSANATAINTILARLRTHGLIAT